MMMVTGDHRTVTRNTEKSDKNWYHRRDKLMRTGRNVVLVHWDFLQTGRLYTGLLRRAAFSSAFARVNAASKRAGRHTAMTMTHRRESRPGFPPGDDAVPTAMTERAPRLYGR
ncbi:hypothetical protein WA026_007132 [Henosepilachna vigintioctopunctata]|uniref:Uncharacterized protein n=1 Tax=Henosepilachna vigintioctopunctata TaxID=420089 RepID=A0AAW1V511_9CUCU